MSFRKEVKDWLEPMGFQPIYSDNHPTSVNDVIHYIKYRVRLCVTLTEEGTYCYLMYESWYRNEYYYIRSGRFGIGESFFVKMAIILELISKIEKKQISKWQRFLNLFKP